MDDPKPFMEPVGELSATEARLAAVLESVSDGFYALDEEWRYILFNLAAERYFGVSAADVLGKVMWDVFPQGIGTDFERFCRGAMHEGLTTRFETSSRLRPDRTVELKIAPMRGGGVCVSLTDITERKRADARATEILESIGDGFYAVDRDWRFTYVNRRAEAWWGRAKSELIGKVIWDVFPNSVGGVIHGAHLEAAATRQPARLEAESITVGSWVDIAIHPTGHSDLSVYVRDIAEQKRNEAARDLLIREVDHRARNVLTVVQSIVQLTHAPDMAHYKETVIGRISALARAQGSLANRRWEGAMLPDVLAEELSAVGKPHAYSLRGPDLMLSPDRVQPLSMIFHELATNASKYGGFSTEAGQVAVEWRIGPEGALDLTWRETGGPAVVEPARRGFGSRLIADLLRQVRGTAGFDWDAAGLIVTLKIPA
jgi:PAS domain S-box-containing protein